MTDIFSAKLAKSTFNSWDLSAGSPDFRFSFSNEPDKLKIPAKWSELVKTIRFYYERDPIASSVINKSIDIGINDLINVQGDANDEVIQVYDSIKSDILSALKDIAREWLLSGLVFPEFSWNNKSIKLSTGEKIYTLPENFWVRDSAAIIAKSTPLPNRINYYIEIDSETIDFILSKGVYPDGTKDVETYNLLVAQYPEFVKAVLAGQTVVPIKDYFMVIKRGTISGKVDPTPYLLPVLESLIYKRKLRKMDYSIASRVIAAIQLITLGNDNFPLRQGDQEEIESLKREVRSEGRENNIERVFQLFGNHTLKIEWIFPDTKAMLDKTKYETANSDIMFGLGFPRILLSGETEKSATSSPEFAMFSPSESLKAMRNELLPFIRKLYAEIAKNNGFDNYPTAKFAELNLFDVAKMAGVVTALLEKASLSKTSALKTAGFEFDEEIANIVRERKAMEENNIPEFNPTPYSNQPNVPGKSAPDTQQQGGKTNGSTN